MLVLVAQSCPALCGPQDCRPPVSFVHGILQSRILEWVAIPFSRGSSRLMDQVSCIVGRFLPSEPPGKPPGSHQINCLNNPNYIVSYENRMKHRSLPLSIHTYKHNTHGKHTYIHLSQIDTLKTQIHTNITHTHIHTKSLCTASPQHTLKHNTHTQTLTHRHGHHGLGLTALLSVGQEECLCLASPGAVCSPELSVSPLRANTLQAEWRRSVTVPQTYTHIEDMGDIFSVIRDPDAQLKNCA